MRHYEITYSVGTSRYDEKRYCTTVREGNLASHIRTLQARENTWIHAVDLIH